jgi:hypothetical protein
MHPSLTQKTFSITLPTEGTFWHCWYPFSASIHTTKSLVVDSCRVSLSHKKFNDITLTKRHDEDSHFLAVHDGNARGAHELILHPCWKEKMPLMVLQISLRYSAQFFIILLCSFLPLHPVYLEAHRVGYMNGNESDSHM